MLIRIAICGCIGSDLPHRIRDGVAGHVDRRSAEDASSLDGAAILLEFTLQRAGQHAEA